MEKLNKNEIIDLVAEKAHLSKVDAKAAVDTTFDLIQEALLNGESVNIKNFCVFEAKQKAERKGTHVYGCLLNKLRTLALNPF